jgi:putative transcriptional regulator
LRVLPTDAIAPERRFPSFFLFVLGYLKLTMKNCLKALRAERGWSQGDLAEHLSVSRQTVNAIETERYDPSLPLALKIAKLFRRPVEAIFAE